MNKLFSKPVYLIATALLIAALLAGCTGQTAASEPTMSPTDIVAAAVETISAQMTQDAVNNPSPTPSPSPTPIPPTETPVPATPTLEPTVEPTNPPTQAPALAASLKYVVTFPENKRIYVPNEKYGLALGFENNGTLTWQAGSYVKLVRFEGEITIQTELAVNKTVAPGERIEFDLWVFGSETLGYHEFEFQLYTVDGIAIPGGVGVYSYTSV